MVKFRLMAFACVLASSACSSPSIADSASSENTQPASKIGTAEVSGAPLTSAEATPTIPSGWTKQWSALGDLNGDGIPDEVLILKPAGSVDGPRRLLVTFGNVDGSKTIAVMADTFLPAVENAIDPFSEDNPLSIKNRTLRVLVEGTGVDLSNETFKFRYQNSGFELIGYDSHNQMRSTGDYEGISINFSTGVIQRTAGNVSGGKDLVTEGRIPARKRLTLQSINLSDGFDVPTTDS